MTEDEASIAGAPASGGWPPLVEGPHVEEAAAYLDAHPGPLDLPAEHPLLPRLAYVLAQRGRTHEAVTAAASLRALGLDVDEDDRDAVQLVADRIGARTWASWLEQRNDDEAIAAARRILATDASLALDSSRLSTLRLSLTTALMRGPYIGEAQVIGEISDLLNALRSQSALLGNLPLELSALSRLALVQVPDGDLDAARRLAEETLAKSALLTGPVRTSTAAAYWRFLASSAQLIVQYFQGVPVEPDRVAELETSLSRFSFDAVAVTVAATVIALDHSQHGRIRQARGLLGSVITDRRFNDLGMWRLRPLVTDAYLAVASGDDAVVRERVRALTSAGAPGEALVMRANQLLGQGEIGSALTAIGGVTSEQVRTVGLSFPAACVLEALLLEESGRAEAAEQSARNALAATERSGALKLFAMHDLPVMIGILERVVAARPQYRWAQEVLHHLTTHVGDADRARPVAVRRAPTDAAKPDAASTPTDLVASASPLTERERQVLAMVNSGASQAQMATDLYVSLNTIKTHLRSIRQKLGVERTGEAAAMARSAGWLDP